jgi:hypothetical protein
MKPVDVEEVLTPAELSQFRQVVEAGIKLAQTLGRSDKVARLKRMLQTAEEQTCQVFPTK